jgi:hypothetical protein
MHLDDSSRTPAPFQPGTTRRTWVRAAANVAWAVPLVSVATAAPAHAATSASTSPALRCDVATFFLWKTQNSDVIWLNPLITVTNPTTQSTAPVTVTLQFSTADFVGVNTVLKPPTPSYADLPVPSVDQSWDVETVRSKRGATVVSVQLTRALGLAAGETSSVGGDDGSSVPFGIGFSNSPTVTSVPILVEGGAGFAVVPWTMSGQSTVVNE